MLRVYLFFGIFSSMGMPYLSQIIESMNNLHMKKDNHHMQSPNSTSDASFLLLPSLSAQACPITIVRENSSLTKRISYSDNLKERSSLQFPKPDRSSGRSVEESSFENICRAVNDDDEERQGNIPMLKGQKSCLHTPGGNSSCSVDIETLKHNSFKECQQILSRIQQKFSNKSLRKSSSIIRSTTSETNSRCIFDRPRKKKISAAVLVKNDSRINFPHNCKRCKKQQSCRHNKLRKKNKEKEHQNEKHNMELESIYMGSLRNANVINKQVQRKEIPVQKTKGRDKDCVIIEAPIVKSVYYSERQSLTVEDIPGVPPSTPNESIVNGIASLSDIKSQRCIQQKLQYIRDRQKKREREVLEAAKAKELQLKLAKRKELMETQRRQIYAINKVLSDIENENFMKFKAETQGVPV